MICILIRYSFILFVLLVVVGSGCAKSVNNLTDLLTSSYAKVARWGGMKTMNEARANLGQTLWTQRSDVNLIRGQNLLIPRKRNNSISFTNKKDNGFSSSNIGRGEVIQERFNARPWISYEVTPNKGPPYIPPPKPNKNNNNNNNNKPQPNYVYSVPFDSSPPIYNSDLDKPSPVLAPPFDNTEKPAMDYDNNAPKNHPNNLNSHQIEKEPNNFVTPSPHYLPAEMDKPPIEMDETGQDDDEEGPPVVQAYDHPSYGDDDHPSYSGDDHNHNGNHNNGNHNNGNHNNGNHNNGNHNDNHNGNDHFQFDQVYINGDQNNDQTSPPKSPDFTNINGLPAYLDHDPHEHGYHFNHYYPYDHHPHIYHEVKTTTPAAEDERLNKKPYSYYYLGRKLWYIPLYFSVYFIIYIFVLILKSIARHKITFNQYFEEDKREMKDTHEEHIHELEDHVRRDINAARTKYIM